MIPTLTRSYAVTAALAGFRIAAFAAPATDRTATVATANDDPFIGVTASLGATAGEMVDIYVAGFASVQLGGPVSAGDPLTSDATGNAVLATPAVGTTVRIIGFADEAGVSGDIVDALLSPGVLHEPA